MERQHTSSIQLQCLFFKHSEVYEIVCDVNLKPIVHINEIKKSMVQKKLLSIFSVYQNLWRT